jgi:hypothetical protein
MKDIPNFVTSNLVASQIQVDWSSQDVSSQAVIQANSEEGNLAESALVIIPLIGLLPLVIWVVYRFSASAYQRYRLHRGVSRLQEIIRLEKLLQLTPDKP